MHAEKRLVGVPRLIAATENSLAGLKSVWAEQEAFRQECWLFVLSVPLGYWLGGNGAERALLIGSVFLILIVELLNSAVEVVVDRIGLEYNELSGRAKDIVSAAVLVTLGQAATIWLLVLLA